MEELGVERKYLEPSSARRFSEVSGSYTYFADGDVLLAKITPCFENGKLGIARGLTNGVGFGSSEYIVFRPGPELYTEYLYYFLNRASFREEGAQRMAGAVGHKRVSLDFIEGYKLPLPPLLEQRRIVAVLDEAFEAIATAKANTERNLDNAREVFESVLDAALVRRDSATVETTLGSEVQLLAGYAFQSRMYTNNPADVRLLRGDNIMQGSLRWADAKMWPRDDVSDFERFALAADDVVLAMDRPWVKAGLKRARIEEADLPCLLVQRTARLRAREGIRPRFLFYLVGSRRFSEHLLGLQTGIGVPHVSGAQIESFPFGLPPLASQDAVVALLDATLEVSNRLADINQRKLTALDELKQSLLHQAFTGALTSKSTDQQLQAVA